jgi:hypothetical protein
MSILRLWTVVRLLFPNLLSLVEQARWVPFRADESCAISALVPLSDSGDDAELCNAVLALAWAANASAANEAAIAAEGAIRSRTLVRLVNSSRNEAVQSAAAFALSRADATSKQLLVPFQHWCGC